MEQTLGVDHGERFDRQESDDRGAEKERRVGRPFGVKRNPSLVWG